MARAAVLSASLPTSYIWIKSTRPEWSWTTGQRQRLLFFPRFCAQLPTGWRHWKRRPQHSHETADGGGLVLPVAGPSLRSAVSAQGSYAPLLSPISNPDQGCIKAVRWPASQLAPSAPWTWNRAGSSSNHVGDHQRQKNPKFPDQGVSTEAPARNLGLCSCFFYVTLSPKLAFLSSQIGFLIFF